MTESEKYLNALIEQNNKITLEIYKKFYPKIERFVLQNNGKQQDAQDVFHDALLYLILKHKEKPLSINSFEAYLFTACKNIWRNFLTKKRVMKDDIIIPMDRETNLILSILEQQRMDFYQEKFQELSNNCKEILGNYFNGMSYQEIVEEFSYKSINTVRQRVFKCKTKLIKLIKLDCRYNKLRQ